MQKTPSEFLLGQIPRDYFEVQPIYVEGTSLRELIEHPRDISIYMNKSLSAGASESTRRAVIPVIHAYAKHILVCWDAEVTKNGAALTKTHSLSYSYWKSSVTHTGSLGLIDAAANTSSPVSSFCVYSCICLQAEAFVKSMSRHKEVIEVLMAVAILHYDEMLHLAPALPYINECVKLGNLCVGTYNPMKVLTSKRTAQCSSPVKSRNEDLVHKQTVFLEQQTKLISALFSQVKLLTEHVAHLENPSGAASLTDPMNIPTLRSEHNTDLQKRSILKLLASVWYEWFCDQAPYSSGIRRRYHDSKVAVAFMRIFLPAGYNVTDYVPDANSRFLLAGQEAEANIRAFLAAKSINAKAVGTIVKALNVYIQKVNATRISDITRVCNCKTRFWTNSHQSRSMY
ncbi:hypothetical protein PHMEG_00017143 [Phytophthora megakarya]|uniref:Uncharacterized protein n=1 Tax=Phytophthora megakarya TaxID=4795 RepID=A0A225VX89_9STRA|nr:hypothetical protein PHMEG_00017143 [Phytophthora megakarya]